MDRRSVRDKAELCRVRIARIYLFQFDVACFSCSQDAMRAWCARRRQLPISRLARPNRISSCTVLLANPR